jgi:hypothetical protein
MLKRSILGPERPDEREVGRITLGERHFTIVHVPTPSHRPDSDEICRFDMNGLRLAVLAEPNARDEPDDLAARLTVRELQVAVLVAQG